MKSACLAREVSPLYPHYLQLVGIVNGVVGRGTEQGISFVHYGSTERYVRYARRKEHTPIIRVWITQRIM